MATLEVEISSSKLRLHPTNRAAINGKNRLGKGLKPKFKLNSANR